MLRGCCSMEWHHSWDNNLGWCCGAHSRAEHARQQLLFLFLWVFLSLHPNNLLSSTALAACHPVSPGELSCLPSTSTAPGLQSGHCFAGRVCLPCHGLIRPEITNHSFSHLMRRKPIKNWLNIWSSRKMKDKCTQPRNRFASGCRLCWLWPNSGPRAPSQAAERTLNVI